MTSRISNRLALVALACLVLLTGCETVSSTSKYYLPYTTKIYPPKPKDAEIPIMGRAPKHPYTAIGKLAFQTSQGWNFLRKSMVYNAQQNGADAVVVKHTSTRDQLVVTEVPPRTDWVPALGYYRCGDRTYSYTNWYPVFRPGYTQAYTDQITAIDAEMIVFKK